MHSRAVTMMTIDTNERARMFECAYKLLEGAEDTLGRPHERRERRG